MSHTFSNSFHLRGKDCRILNGGFVGDLLFKLPYPKSGCERFFRFEFLPNDYLITNRRSSFQNNQLVESVGIYVFDQSGQIVFSIPGEFSDVYLLSREKITFFRMREDSAKRRIIERLEVDWKSGEIVNQEIILGEGIHISSIQFNLLRLDTNPNPKISLVINPSVDGKSDYNNSIQWNLIEESKKSESEIIELKSLVTRNENKYLIDDNSIWRIYLELPSVPQSRKGDYYPVHHFSLDLQEFGDDGVILLSEYEHSKGGGFYDGLLKFDSSGNQSYHIIGEYVNWVAKESKGSGLFLKLTQGIYDLDLDNPIFSLDKINLKTGNVKSIKTVVIDSKERMKSGIPQKIRYLGYQFKDNKLICKLGFESFMKTVDWTTSLNDI
ncbi:hypothetical protein [Leptospira sp. GIMC2001]|uniref:hypothetical protein n=1 Tax=Leptospira sp. GIMC2001 TaxID=1513297 RepID=UPI00234AD5DC|nr:hypothetical protein [Leptospira sp. GIMC2001]WCL49648.1 hypothetical protein O4O04_02180 [Leptospira sp. GIMC2001]